MQEAIRRRATELYHQGGALAGRSRDPSRIRHKPHSPRAVVVNLQGVVHTGEYEAAAAEGYTPGEWKPGDPVRLAGDKLYLRRPNGQELQTTIVKRIR